MGQLLCLLTTCSLGEWFKWGRKVTAEGALLHQPVYLHDYDLLVAGVDFSPRMIGMAKRHLQLKGFIGILQSLMRTSSSSPNHTTPLSLTCALFRLRLRPTGIVTKTTSFCARKIIVDLTLRHEIALQDGMTILKAARFHQVTWRPFFVPQKKPLPTQLLRELVVCESIPLCALFPCTGSSTVC